MPTNPDPDLMRIFGFTASDLEANRAGKISDAQIQQLQNMAKSQKEETGCLALFMLPIYGMLGCMSIQQFTVGNRTFAVIMLIIVIMLALAEVYNLYDRYYRDQPAEKDILHGKIEITEGQLQLIIKKRQYGASIRYIDDDYLHVQDKDFPIKKGTRKQIEQFLASKSTVPTCRIYYVPKSLQIIAAEIIE